MSLSLFVHGHLSYWISAPTTPVRPHLNQLYQQRPYFTVRPRTEILEGYEFCGDTIQLNAPSTGEANRTTVF